MSVGGGDGPARRVEPLLRYRPSQPAQYPPRFTSWVHKVHVVVGDQPVTGIGIGQYALVIPEPEVVVERFGAAHMPGKRPGSLDGIAKADNHLQPGQHRFPEGERQAAAGILPAPRLPLAHDSNELLSPFPEGVNVGLRLPARGHVRQQEFPVSGEVGQDLLGQLIHVQALPVAGGIPLIRRHDQLLRPQVKATQVEHTGHQGGAGAVHAGDADCHGPLHPGTWHIIRLVKGNEIGNTGGFLGTDFPD